MNLSLRELVGAATERARFEYLKLVCRETQESEGAQCYARALPQYSQLESEYL